MPSSPEAPPTLLHTLDLNKHYSTLSVDSSLHDRQEASHCHYSTFTDDGKFLLVCDLGSSSVTVFDLTTSPPSPVHTYSPSPDAGCRHLALVGDDVYIMCELISSVAVCKLNLETGELTESNIIPLLPSGTSEPTRAHHRGGGGIVADESGNFIYATLRNTVPGAVVALKRDAETGNVEIHKRAESGGEIPRCITCVGDDLVFVANQEDRKLCCFKGKGELELLAEVGDFDCSIAFVGELTG